MGVRARRETAEAAKPARQIVGGVGLRAGHEGERDRLTSGIAGGGTQRLHQRAVHPRDGHGRLQHAVGVQRRDPRQLRLDFRL